MKYYEQVKSFILLLLVALSIFLTFLIWRYQPNYKVIEDTQVETKKIGNPIKVEESLLPYRIISSENDKLVGDVTNKDLTKVLDAITSWKATGLDFEKNSLVNDDINQLITKNHHITLFYSAEVPIRVFQSILPFSESEITNISFNRLIIDWSNVKEGHLKINFVNTNNKTLYSTKVSISESEFQNSVLKSLENAISYKEVPRMKNLSLFVPIEEVKMNEYTYFIEENATDHFRDVLFNDPNIVKKNNESENTLKYTDGMSLMTVDTKNKTFNFVNPTSENMTDISIADLWKYSFDFINNHGGFNGDYRYSSINVKNHVIDYQLFIHGYPVYSDMTSTQITAIWGNNQIFRYKRPYYYLDMDISSAKKEISLPTSDEVMERIDQMGTIRLSTVDEILTGYYIAQKDDNQLLYTLVPCWFAIANGIWVPITPEIGGGEYGLE